MVWGRHSPAATDRAIPDWGQRAAHVDGGTEAVLTSLVASSYVRLMGAGITRADDQLLEFVGRSSRRVTGEQVLLMLEGLGGRW